MNVIGWGMGVGTGGRVGEAGVKDGRSRAPYGWWVTSQLHHSTGSTGAINSSLQERQSLGSCSTFNVNVTRDQTERHTAADTQTT
jgi:hypothetical protein